MDSTIGILSKGYTYFQEKFNQNQTDILETRLLLKKTIAMRGEEAAQLFYDQKKFKRDGATPKRFQKTLFGVGGVQGLDSTDHEHRKALFMQCMKPDLLSKMNQLVEKYWLIALDDWKKQKQVNLFRESEKILTQASCEWVGVPLHENEINLRTNQLADMIDASGAVGRRHRQGRTARKKAEKWISKLVDDIRNKRMRIEENSILFVFSFHKDLNGNLLEKRIIAVEILNLLRPIVAIARYLVFMALAIHDHTEYIKRFQHGSEDLYHAFVQEVRRFYPFFPFTAAIVKQPFEYKGIHFFTGRRVILDLYATNHDQRIWDAPNLFKPERFLEWKENAFNFIPQGGGDHDHNHRCAGEWMTIQVMEVVLKILINRMTYTVPPQDLSIKMNRIPAIPKSEFKIIVSPN